MAQQVRWSEGDKVVYQPSSKTILKLNRGMVLRELYLTLAGTITTGAEGDEMTAANVLAGDEWGVIRRIDLTINGGENLRSFSGEALQWLNAFFYGTTRRLTAGFTGAGATTVPFESTLILPLWNPRTIRPMDTALDSRILSALNLEITWGTPASVTSAAGAAFSVAPSLSVTALQSFNVNGPFGTSRIFSIQDSVAAATDQKQIQLPVGQVYRGLVINIKDADGADAVDLIQRIKIKSGPTVFMDVDADVLSDAHLAKLGVRSLDFVSSKSSMDGWYFVEFCSDGYLSEGIDTIGMSELVLELKMLGAANINVYPMEIRPIRKSA